MRTPSKLEFNNWSIHNKLWWINYETRGVLGSPGTPGFIFYPLPEHDYAIRYMHNSKGEIQDPVVIPLKNAINEYKRVMIGLESMGDLN